MQCFQEGELRMLRSIILVGLIITDSQSKRKQFFRIRELGI